MTDRQDALDERLAIMLEAMTTEELEQFQDAMSEEYARRLQARTGSKPRRKSGRK